LPFIADPICPADKPYFIGWYCDSNKRYDVGDTLPNNVKSIRLYAKYSSECPLPSHSICLIDNWKQTNYNNINRDNIYNIVYELSYPIS
jgi:hypothetical protein